MDQQDEQMGGEKAGVVVHLCGLTAWDEARTSGEVIPPTAAADGFIHLSQPHTVAVPANAFYAGRDDLVLLWIDPARVDGEIRYEQGSPPSPDGQVFPHLYGRLPVAAVTATSRYLPGDGGVFVAPDLPPGVTD